MPKPDMEYLFELMDEVAVKAGIGALAARGIARPCALYIIIKESQRRGNNGLAAAAVRLYETEAAQAGSAGIPLKA